MDEDIRAALFDDADEEGGAFEELNDDFVSQAMTQPMEEDFDFDAHIAALIARRSARGRLHRHLVCDVDHWRASQ